MLHGSNFMAKENDQITAGTMEGLFKGGLSGRQLRPTVRLYNSLPTGEFAGFEEATGRAMYNMPDGRTAKVNVASTLQQNNLDPVETKVIYNSSDKALNQAAPSLTGADRLKLSVGNTRGKIKYLKNKFDAVVPDKDLGLVVQEDGTWYRVDPNIWTMDKSDPWEVAKELGRDIADLADIGINIAATGGAYLAGGAQMMTGAGIPTGIATLMAAGAAAGGTRVSLGRYAGTYEAPIEERLMDIGLESVLTAGGEFIAPGAKVGIQKLLGSTNNLKNSAAREVISTTYGTLTGVGSGAMNELIDNGTKVAAKMNSTIGKVGKGAGARAAVLEAHEQALKQADELLDLGIQGLPKKYGQVLNEVFTEAEKQAMDINMSNVVMQSMLDIEKSGAGKILIETPLGLKSISEYVEHGFKAQKQMGGLPMGSSEREILERQMFRFKAEIRSGKRALKYKFRPFTEAERTDLLFNKGVDAKVLGRQELKIIKDLVSGIGSFGLHKRVSGKNAARLLTDFNKHLNRMTTRAFKEPGVGDVVSRTVAQAQAGSKNAIAGEFKRVKLDQKYLDMQKIYGQYEDAIKFGRSLKKSMNGSEQLVDRLLNDRVKGQRQIGLAQQLAELAGKRGKHLYNDMITNETASRFLSWAPKMGLMQSLVAGGGMASALSGVIHPGMALTFSQFSPRVVANQAALARGAGHFLDYLKSLGPKQMSELLQNPKVFNNLFRTTLIEYTQEQDLVDKLVGQASGAMNPNVQ
jgi:hypothetical protein